MDGRVTDPSGASIAGAQVKITNADTQQVRQTTTDSDGRYQLPNLPVGNYQLEVSTSGFKTYVQQGIVLEVGQNISNNVTMQIGAVSESVEVTAAAAMVETKDNAISQVIDQKRIVDLPLNGRNPTQLITLTGAGTTTPAGDLTGSKNIGGSNTSGTFSVAGGQPNGNNYLLDGGDNNDPFSNVNLPLPFPDALQEFSVQTNALPAQFGLHPGAAVNAVTRSGTNAYHGTLFEFLRNGDFNARQEGTLARDTLKRNQFGGVFGGRIIRDKLFFFGGYQGTRQRSTPPTTISFIPNQTVLTTGNFSKYTSLTSQGGCLTSGAAQTLKDPRGGTFAGNVIPTSRFDPASVALVTKYLPSTADPCGRIQYGVPANNSDDQYIGRVDYLRNEKHSMYGRYYIYNFLQPSVFDGVNALTTTTAGNDERSQTATFGDTYTFSATKLNSFHATFNRRRDNRGLADNMISPSTLGININQLLPHFLQVTVSNGYFSVGCGTCAQGYFNTNTYQVSDDFTIIHEKHQFQLGVDVRRQQMNVMNNQQSNGQFNFDGSVSGNALADFMLGIQNTYNQGNPNPNALRQTVFAAYVQDTYRMSPRLTLNLGVRWEPNIPPFDAQDRGGQFQLAGFLNNVHSTQYPNAPAGEFFVHDPQNKYGAALTKSHWLSTSPRVGIVWDVNGDGKQTIRTAFALMHDISEMFFPERLTTNPPYASSVTLNDVPFSNPWATYPGGNPFPGASIFPLAGTYVNIPPNMQPTYMMQWNFSYQRQLSANWLLTLNYLGNGTRHIWLAHDINPAIPTPVVVNGVLQAPSTRNTNARRILNRINPAQGQYYSSIVEGDDGGISNYHGVLISVQHRFAQHFTVLSNYTWSHCISDYDFLGELAGNLYQNPGYRRGERGSCYFDHRHIFNTSLVALSGGLGPGFWKTLTSNWQLSPIITASSGAPYTIQDGADFSLSGAGQDRPNQVLSNPYPANQTVQQWINPAAFKIQPAGTFGNVGRSSVNMPGQWNIDLSLSRIFKFTERWNLEARGDAFNVLNHGNWMLFSAGTTTQAITSSTFGQITQFSSPRIIQLSMKLNF
ncbi:MAG: TonB-dependent receptor [Acidobacteriaceae bacterium]|nr:TonB-dependent receptor [Acidobacteriaceae bacterium]